MSKFSEYIRCERLTFWVWKLLGIWATSDESPYYRAFRRIYHFCFTVIYLFCIFVSIFFKDNFEDVWGEIMFILLTEMAMFVKFVIIVSNFETVYRLHRTTISEEFKPVTSWEKQLHRRFFSFFDPAMLAYYFVSFCALWTHLGFLFEFKLPFFSWFFWLPLDAEHAVNYYVIFAYQMFGMVGHMLINVSGDMQIAYLLASAGLQLDFLNERLANLPISSTRSIVEQNHYRATLLKHIEHYERIFRFVKEIEQTFSAGIFAQICASGITVCATVLRLTSIDLIADIGTVIPMVFYLTAMLTQLFLPCYYGNEVTLKSSRTTNALYSSEWHILDRAARKDLKALMLRTNRPIGLKAGQFFCYNLEAFRSTLNTAYSIYAIVNNKK